MADTTESKPAEKKSGTAKLGDIITVPKGATVAHPDGQTRTARSTKYALDAVGDFRVNGDVITVTK